ncbi:MAG: rhodanese-like domain-containing protein [Acidimicrobiales bacterium]
MGSVSPEEAWRLASSGEAEILDLRTGMERDRFGWPPGSKKVSMLTHFLLPQSNKIYLCQHAVRSKVPAARGAREVEGGFSLWASKGLPVQHGVEQSTRG